MIMVSNSKNMHAELSNEASIWINPPSSKGLVKKLSVK